MVELSLAVGIERQRVERLLMAARGLDHPISSDPGADTIGDRLADPRAEDAYERVTRTLDTARQPLRRRCAAHEAKI